MIQFPRANEDADAMTRRLRAMSRARKLLRLAEDQADTAEGRSALATAEALLAQHGLTRGGLELGDEDNEFRQRSVEVGRAEPWRLTLCHAVADAFDCVALYRNKSEAIELFGPKHALPMVEYVFVVYLRSLQTAWRKQAAELQEAEIWSAMSKVRQLAAREAFCVSFVLGVKERLERERREEADADVTTGNASAAQRKDLAGWMRRTGVRYRARPQGVVAGSPEGYRAGFETEVEPALKAGVGPRKITG